MKQYAFFLDIDGTLAEKKQVHKENSRAIYEAQQKGHFVFINTGRSYCFLPEYVTKSAEFDGFVCGLGADIRYHGKQIFSKTFSAELLDQLLKIFWNLSESVALFEGENHIYYKNKWFDMEHSIPLTAPDDFVKKYHDVPISKLTCSTEDKALFKPFSSTLNLYDMGHYYELAQTGINKGSAMLRTAELLGIPKAQCVAIGDSRNDEDMLKDAGIAVVMENGHEEMKKIADFVTDRAENAGVAKAIDKIIGL